MCFSAERGVVRMERNQWYTFCRNVSSSQVRFRYDNFAIQLFTEFDATELKDVFVAVF